MYIKISNPLDGNKIIVNGENIDLILWEVNFPLTENASLEFPSLTGGKNYYNWFLIHKRQVN